MIKAVIFDMDDTLVATAGLWREAETRLLASIGAPWSESLATQYKGMNALDVAATIHRALQPKVELQVFQQRMRSFLLEGFCAEYPADMPGAAKCVKRMAAAPAKLAVASGSPLDAIEAVITQMGVRELFSVILSSESVARGKPFPDIFLAAAERLGVPPEECCVMEDSLIGVQAALAAGMRCVAVPSGGEAGRAAIVQLGAEVAASLDHVTWEQVAGTTAAQTRP